MKMPRGLLAMAVDDRTIYWARLGGDGRSTEFGAVPVDGSTPPRSLGRVEGTVFDGLAVGDGELIVSTSAAQQPGIVARLPLKGGDVTAFKSVDRVWQLLSDSKGSTCTMSSRARKDRSARSRGWSPGASGGGERPG